MDYCTNCQKEINQIDLGEGSFGCPICKRDDCIEIYKTKKQKITPEKIEEIIEAISFFEYKKNGMHSLNGTNVEVKNLRIRGEKAIADIILIFENRKENFNDLEYDIKLLGVEI